MGAAAVVQLDDGLLWVLRGSTWSRAQYVGTVAVNCGAFPSSGGSVAVIGQDAIQATSIVSASVRLVDTVDHSADEARIEALHVSAGLIVPGVGFTVYVDCVDGWTSGIFNVDWKWV